MKWSADNPPPLEPPAELNLTYGHRVWRLAARWWREHQPDESGHVCRACGRLWPCSGFESAEDILMTSVRRASLGD
ncbi:MAG: hypothetical protein ACRDJ9_21985 [Dehalococcoidia bacterium]